MSKKYFLLLFFSFVVFFYGFKIDIIIGEFFKSIILNSQKSLTNYSKQISNYYLNLKKLNLKNKKLQNQIATLQKYKILNKIYKNKLEKFEKILSLKQTKYDLILAKVISYINFNNYSLVFLDLKIDSTKPILPLFDINGYASGIVVKKNDKFIGILNNNKKSNYAVFIGKQKAPGITMGYKDGFLVVKFVPIFYDIKKDDLVITSGLDNIFPNGVEVGRVKNILKEDQSQIVLVKPFGKINLNYYYILN